MTKEVLSPSRFLADLKWVFSSPNYFSLPQPNHQMLGEVGRVVHSASVQSIRPFYTQLFERRADRRLGYYFEHLVMTGLALNSKVSILAENLQLQDSERTVGEVDLIIEWNNEVWHVECAIKFYLSTRNSNDPETWIGPNAKDSLAKKFLKLRDHQLPIGGSDILKSTLNELSLPHPKKSVCLSRGWVFYHFKDLSFPAGLSDDVLDPTCQKGIWCYEHEVSAFIANLKEPLHWVELPKLQWLNHPLDSLEIEKRASHKPVYTTKKAARHFALYKNKGGQPGFEFRVFVMPDNWPNR